MKGSFVSRASLRLVDKNSYSAKAKGIYVCRSQCRRSVQGCNATYNRAGPGALRIAHNPLESGHSDTSRDNKDGARDGGPAFVQVRLVDSDIASEQQSVSPIREESKQRKRSEE